MPSSSPDLRRRYPGWALVTGASSGIGAGFAEALARAGFDIVLVARGEERLRAEARKIEEQFGVKTRVLIEDLSSQGAGSRVARSVEDLEIGVLVNNAGTGWIGRFDLQTPEDHARLIALHCTLPTDLVRRFMGAMKERGDGAIVLVSSAGALVPLPYYAVYGGTKAYLSSWGEALAEELRGTGVDLLVVQPGDTKTGFQDVAGEMSTKWTSVETVVSESLAALGRKTTVIPGFSDRLTMAITRFLPRRLLVRILRARGRDQTPADRR
jgi:short-subunit dehydrogenase